MSKFASLSSRRGNSVSSAVSADQLFSFFEQIYAQHREEEITFVCIGTDRSTGDALGPITGSYLLEHGFTKVWGTLAEPCDATNLEQRLAEIADSEVVIAVDACLGLSGDVGRFICRRDSLLPARSVNGQLPAVGHYSIAGIVNVNGPKPYSILQMTSLHQVMNMASQIADAAKLGLKQAHMLMNK